MNKGTVHCTPAEQLIGEGHAAIDAVISASTSEAAAAAFDDFQSWAIMSTERLINFLVEARRELAELRKEKDLPDAENQKLSDVSSYLKKPLRSLDQARADIAAARAGTRKADRSQLGFWSFVLHANGSHVEVSRRADVAWEPCIVVEGTDEHETRDRARLLAALLSDHGFEIGGQP